MSSSGLRAARAGALEVVGGAGGAPFLGRRCSGSWSLAIPFPGLRAGSGEGGAGRGGRSSRGDRAPFSHSAHSSLSSSCNFSRALRFNLSQPDPAAALADAGGGPSPRSPPRGSLWEPQPIRPAGARPVAGGCAARLRWFWEGALGSLPFLIQLSPAPGLGGAGRWHLYRGGWPEPETLGGVGLLASVVSGHHFAARLLVVD